MITVSEESAVDFERTARIATEAFGSKDVIFSAARMKWLYERAFGAGYMVVAALDDGKKVGQIVLLHQKIYLDGRPVVATQLVDLFILQAYRSQKLLPRIYQELERLCEACNIRLIITLPNAHSGGPNAHFLKLRPFLSLPVRAGVSLGSPRPARLQFSGAIQAMRKDEVVERLSGFVTPLMENGPHWDAGRLFDRMSDPTRGYAVHATADLLLISSSRKTRGISHVLLCGFFARPETIAASSEVRELIRAACHLWQHRIFVYAGINNRLARLPGFPLPARLRSPVLVQIRDFDSGGADLHFDRFQLTDSDFV
jgi:GNAT superfamily N-acetyltransferase